MIQLIPVNQKKKKKRSKRKILTDRAEFVLHFLVSYKSLFSQAIAAWVGWNFVQIDRSYSQDVLSIRHPSLQPQPKNVEQEKKYNNDFTH